MISREQQEQMLLARSATIYTEQIYPKINICVSKQAEPPGISITVTLQETKEASEKIQTFQLPEINGRLDSANITPLPGPIQNLRFSNGIDGNNGKVTLEWQNPNSTEIQPLQLHILPAADLVVQGTGSVKSLDLKTTESIITQHPINAKHLSLKGRKVVVNSSISSSVLQVSSEELLVKERVQGDCITIHADNEFCNQGIIESRTLKITTSHNGKIVNQNTIRAKEKCSVSGPSEFHNSGLIDANIIDAKDVTQFINSGSMISKDSFIARGREKEKVTFKNSGEIVSKTLTLSRITEASNTGTLLAQERLKCAAQYFENLSNISAKEASFTNKYRFVNTKSGVIKCEKLHRLDCHEGLCKNAGLIFVRKGGSTQFVKDFRNSGRYISEGPIIIFADGQVRNKGPLVSKDSIRIFAEKNVVNAKEASILSDGPAELLSKSSVKNYSKIKSGELDIHSLDFKNTAEASIIAKTLWISTLKNIKNKGFLGGKSGIYIKALGDLLNEQNATIRSGGPLGIQARNMFNDGKIKSTGQCDTVTQGDFTQHLKGIVESLSELIFKVQGNLSNAGKLSAQHKLDIWARDILKNTGLIKAPSIIVHSEGILDNLMQGIIFAGEKLNLFSREILENSGVVLSNGPLKVEAEKILKNLKEGKIAAYKDMQLLAGHVLSNAGKILGDDKVTLEAAQWFENALGGEVVSEKTLTILSKNRLDNFGKLEGKNKLYVEALEIIHNHEQGVCASQSLEAVSKWALRNEGVLHSEGSLKLEVDLILENYSSGRITASDSLQLLNASIIRNSGEVIGTKTVLAHAKSVLHNLQSGRIQGNEALSLLSNYAFENSGQLLSERIHVDARRLLQNRLAGKFHAEKDIKLNSEQFVLNSGSASSEGSLSIHSDAIKNFASGEISAANAITLIAQHHIEQAGKATAKNVTIESQSLKHSGTTVAEKITVQIKDMLHNDSTGQMLAQEELKIQAEHVQQDGLMAAKNVNVDALSWSQHGIVDVETLTSNFNNIFKLHEDGKISASKAVSVLTENLILLGKLIGKGEYRLEVKENFEYSPDTLWACGLLKLIMHKDYCFKKPMNILGALELVSFASVNVQTSIDITQTANIFSKNLIIEKGATLSAQQLKAYISNLLQVNQGASLKNVVELSSETLNHHGEMYSYDDLTFLGRKSIYTTGSIGVNGKARFTSPAITFQGEKASLEVGRDCEAQGDFTSYYANIKIGGQFHHSNGTLVVRSHELDRREREARRKKDNALFRSILGSIVSIGASFFLGPIALGLGKCSFLVKGAIAGGLSSVFSGKDPIEGVVSGAMFAKFDNVIGNVLKNRITSEIMREAVFAGSKGILETAIRGGDPFYNVLCRAGSTALAHSVLPSSNEFQSVFSQPKILQEVGKSMGRSLIISTFSRDLSKSSLGENMIHATLDGLQTFANIQEQEYAHRNRNLSLRERFRNIQKNIQEENGVLNNNDQRFPGNDNEGTYFVLPMYRRRRKTASSEDSFCIEPIKPIPSTHPEVSRKQFSLRSVFPDSDPNPFMNHAIAVGRGIEKGRDLIVDAIIHPIDTAKDLGFTVWDGCNAITKFTIGISNKNSNKRNELRCEIMANAFEDFKIADSVSKLEKITEVLTAGILGVATGGAIRGVGLKVLATGGLAIPTPHCHAIQGFTLQCYQIRNQVKQGATLYRAAPTAKRAQEGLYWASEIPGPNYAAQYGLPPSTKLNYMSIGHLKSAHNVISRKAPGIGNNPGGKIEIVTGKKDSVQVASVVEITDLNIINQVPGNKSKMHQLADKVLQMGISEVTIGSVIMTEKQMSVKQNVRK